MAKYNDVGEEIPNVVPVALPVGYQHPESLPQMVARMVRTQISQVAGAKGLETFEEADDFDINDEEGSLVSNHQMTEMEEELPIFKEDRKNAGGKGEQTRSRTDQRSGNVDRRTRRSDGETKVDADGERRKNKVNAGSGKTLNEQLRNDRRQAHYTGDKK